MDDTTPAPAPDTDTEAPPDPAGGAAPAGGPSDDERDAALPEWARAQLSRARAEAARYRTRLREVEPAAARAVEAETTAAAERAAMAGRLAAAEAAAADAARWQVALDHGLTRAQARRPARSTLAALRWLTTLPRTVRQDFSAEFVAGRGAVVNVRKPVSADAARTCTKAARFPSAVAIIWAL